MSRGSAASNGLFASFTSFFNAGGTQSSSSSTTSKNGYLERKRTAFGGGLPSSMRTGQANGLDEEDGAWSLPYSYYNKQHKAATSSNGQYPPGPSPAATSFSGLESSTTINMMGSQGQSTSTLVPAQGRPSMTLSSNVSFPSTAYPPLKHTWRRIRNWCDTHYTELADTLNWPAMEAQLDDLELVVGFALPSSVRDSYLCYNGQELESNNSCCDGLFFGLPLLSLEQIAEEWSFWRSVDDDAATGANAEVKGWMSSCPAGWVRSEYSCRGWIPLITDRVGNYIGVDLSPNPQGGGSPGQVILFGRDFDTKIVLWRGEGEGGWGRFLQYVAEELEGGEMWTLEDNNSTDSNDEEDTIGYEPYFSNAGGGASRGGGDRGGDGAVGFKLRGEYKGWPVLEAWADRSMRCWEEVGLSTGQPQWQADPPSVLVNDEAGPSQVAESSKRGLHVGVVTQAESSHPLEETNDTSASSTLSPPLPSSRADRAKQKRREEPTHADGKDSPSPSPKLAQRVRKPPPAPAAPLDLPTIDDVRAAHAAALASQRKSGTYHYDVERGRPPAGMGGMGMGMGMASTAPSPHYTARYAHRQNVAAREANAMAPAREEDAVELDNRSSTDVLNPRHRDSGLSTEEDALQQLRGKSSPLHSPRSSLGASPAQPTRVNGRTLYAPSGSKTGVESLIDATSATDLNGGRSRLDEVSASHTSEPFVSSPLASDGTVFASLQGASSKDTGPGRSVPSAMA